MASTKDYADPVAAVASDDQQELMRLAVRELMSVHSVSERVAASLILTITSVVRLAPKE
jgi:hypothetical protein